MAWIEIVEEPDGAPGKAANILRLHSLQPKTQQAHRELYRALMFGHSDLTRREREMIAVSVSVLNRCHY